MTKIGGSVEKKVEQQQLVVGQRRGMGTFGRFHFVRGYLFPITRPFIAPSRLYFSWLEPSLEVRLFQSHIASHFSVGCRSKVANDRKRTSRVMRRLRIHRPMIPLRRWASLPVLCQTFELQCVSTILRRDPVIAMLRLARFVFLAYTNPVED